MLALRVSPAVMACLLVFAPWPLAWADDTDGARPGPSGADERAALEQRVADLEAELAELKTMLLALSSSGEAAAPPAPRTSTQP